MFAGVNALRAGLRAPPRDDPWRDPELVAGLFFPRAARIEAHVLVTRAASVAAYLDEQWELHPMWIEARQALATAGTLDEVRQSVSAAYAAANESPDAFAVSSRYLVTTVVVSRSRPSATAGSLSSPARPCAPA